METKALLVLDTWATSTDFKTDLINTMKSNGLNIITDLEATDIVLAVNYMTSLIYSYYKNYYLSNASKERTLELMSITASGKLNFYASELKAYKDAYTHDFKSLGGNENSSTHDTTLNRSGKSKQATTPETIAKGTDYIDDYSSSEQKYENANTEKGTRSFNSTIKGSEQDYWKNIISIPKRLYEDIIGSFSKFFFSSSMELTPCAVLTIEQAIQKLKDEIKSSDTTPETEINSLKSLIKINQEEIKDLKTSVDTLVTAGENTDNRVTTLEKQTGDIQRKIDKTNTNLENLTKVTPTDVAIKNKKLGLKHDTTWLTNQDAITLGDNFTYDETTKTLNVKGGNSIGIITLTQDQYNEINDNSTITFTTEQANLIKQDDIGTIIIKFGNLSLYKMTLTKIFAGSIDDNLIIYTLNAYVKLVNENVLYMIVITNFTQPAPISIISLPNQYLSNVELGGIGYPTNCLSFSVKDGNSFISLYTDKINGSPIIHEIETDVKNYIIGDYTAFQEDDHTNYVKILLKKNNVEEYYGGYVPKVLNATAIHKVLRSVNNSMSWEPLPSYYEHDGKLRIGDNYISFKYIVQDGGIYSFDNVINLLDTQYIMASGMFMYYGVAENVYGINFNSLHFMTNEILENGTLSTNEIPFTDVTIGRYTEDVRLIV